MLLIKGEGISGRGGIYGIADEFNCSLERAFQYLQILKSGTYGESDINDKVLHRARAPQNIYRLLQYFRVDEAIIKKLIGFHIKHKNNNNRTSPPDDIVLQQLDNNERLMGHVSQPKEVILRHGLIGILDPRYDDELRKHYPNGLWYVSRPNNVDVIEATLNVHDELLKDILHGLGFGYRMVDVFNYVRHKDPVLVDKICGNVDELVSFPRRK